MVKNTWIITSPKAVFNDDAIYYFKKTVQLKNPQTGKINITAEARYKLWINGNVVSFGPYKSDNYFRRYDTVDISKYFKEGENEFFAEVLQLSADDNCLNNHILNSVIRSGRMAFLIWGEAVCEKEKILISTDDSWECAKAGYRTFIESNWFAGLNENVSSKEETEWVPAKKICKYNGRVSDYGEILMWHLKGHDLPAQKYDLTDLKTLDNAGNYDFGKITTGFVRIYLKGTGKVRLTYAECYAFYKDGKVIKKNRIDSTGEIIGEYDIVEVDGERVFETFWFRTFRFIKAEVEGDVIVEKIQIAETGYPLTVDNNYDFGNETDNKLFDICVNTLKNCMHETYEDCPYYEQLQYSMDTYTQMIFNMRLSDDIRLVKNGIELFAASITPDGMCQSRFPAMVPQYITGFNLYFVYMLDELEKNRGEHEFIKQFLGAVDSIILAFEKIKGLNGLIQKTEYWEFIDWAEDWERGVPPSNKGDAITVINLMYAYALEKAARLNCIFNRNDTAAEYKKNAEEVKALVKSCCYCKKTGLYADTDKKESFSQHAQIWAVLCEIDDIKTQKRILNESMNLTAKGGFAFSYLAFRTFEKAGVYELGEELLKQYRGLLELNCTTIPETPNNPRSECHGWGAVIINEFTSVILGVDGTGDKIIIKPYIKGRNKAKGVVYTKHGKVSVAWEICNGKFKITADAKTEIMIIMPDDTTIEGVCKISASCDLNKIITM